ncbi:hypothetical protein T484DRAFT_1912443, partial [Baffinella frigidus]
MSAFGAWLSRAPPPESRKGVGVTLKILETEGVAYIAELLPGSSAWQSSLTIDDRVTHIDGTPVKGKSVAQLTDMLLGEDGSVVELRIDCISKGDGVSSMCRPNRKAQPRIVRLERGRSAMNERKRRDGSLEVWISKAETWSGWKNLGILCMPTQHVLFVFSLRLQQHSWEVEKRFSEFAALDWRLREHFGDVKMDLVLGKSRLPGKTFIDQKSAGLIKKRKERLRNYIDALAQHHAVSRCDLVRSFLQYPDALFSKPEAVLQNWDGPSEEDPSSPRHRGSSGSSSAAAGGQEDIFAQSADLASSFASSESISLLKMHSTLPASAAPKHPPPLSPRGEQRGERGEQRGSAPHADAGNPAGAHHAAQPQYGAHQHGAHQHGVQQQQQQHGGKEQLHVDRVAVQAPAFALSSAARPRVAEGSELAVTPEGAAAALLDAWDRGHEQTAARCRAVMAANFETACAAPAFLRLPAPLVSGLLADPTLNAREQAVFEAALNWALAQPHPSPRKASGSRGAFDGRETLLAHVRFPLMAPEALVLRVLGSEEAARSGVLKDMATEAVTWQAVAPLLRPQVRLRFLSQTQCTPRVPVASSKPGAAAISAKAGGAPERVPGGAGEAARRSGVVWGQDGAGKVGG